MTEQKAIDIMKTAGFADAGICAFTKESLRRTKKSLPNIDGIKSIIIGVYPYYSQDNPNRNLSLFAVPPDYHITLYNMLNSAAASLKKLAPEHSFSPFADNSPIFEVDAACRAGLGIKGRHNLLITPRYGSFVFIGELLTSMPFPKKDQHITPCDNCGLCEKACPTAALMNGAFKRELCISHISQKKGVLSREEKDILLSSPTVWGCDICQLACPLNKNISLAPPLEDGLWHLSAGDISSLSAEDFKRIYGDRVFSWRGKDTILRNLNLKENK